MKKYSKCNESSYTMYLDANNFYGWAISVDRFEWKKNVSKSIEKFVKNYDEDSDKGYILEEYVKYRKRLHNLHYDFPFLPEKCIKLA